MGVGPGLPHQILHRLHEQIQAPYGGHIQGEGHRREGHREEQLQHHLISGSKEAKKRVSADESDAGNYRAPREIKTEEGGKQREGETGEVWKSEEPCETRDACELMLQGLTGGWLFWVGGWA